MLNTQLSLTGYSGENLTVESNFNRTASVEDTTVLELKFEVCGSDVFVWIPVTGVVQILLTMPRCF